MQYSADSVLPWTGDLTKYDSKKMKQLTTIRAIEATEIRNHTAGKEIQMSTQIAADAYTVEIAKLEKQLGTLQSTIEEQIPNETVKYEELLQQEEEREEMLQQSFELEMDRLYTDLGQIQNHTTTIAHTSFKF